MFNGFILENILQHTNSGKDYKSFVLVNKLWYSIMNKLFPHGDTFANHLLTLIKLFPKQKWDYEYLSLNPSINIEFVLKNINKKWNYSYLTKNPGIKFKDIFNTRSTVKWDYDCLPLRDDVTWDDIKGCPDISSLEKFAQSPNALLDGVLDDMNKTVGIDFRYLAVNPSLTSDFIEQHPEISWNYIYLSANTNLPLEFIEKNNYRVWDFQALSYNKNITWEFIQKHIDEDWDFIALSYHPNITLDIILNNPDEDWDEEMISRNPNVRWEDVQNIKSINWNYNYLASNEGLFKADYNIYKHFPKNKYCYNGLTGNHKIPIETILENRHLPWNIGILSSRSDLKWHHVANNPLIGWELFGLAYG